MVDALPGPIRRPRQLPVGEPLARDGYRRLVGVLEAVDRAADLPEFRERLVNALQSWFGFAGVAVLHGGTLQEALDEGCGVMGGYSAEFLAEYESRWFAADPFRSEAAARLLLSNEVAVLRALPGHEAYLERFLLPHGITDKTGIAIDGGTAGLVYLGTASREGRTPAHALAAMNALHRHLAPLVHNQLARHHEQTARKAAWHLTPREWDVAQLAAQGLTNRQIAARLFVGIDTVKKHLTRVLAETGTASRTQLALRWQQAAQPSGPRGRWQPSG
ncbi:LuxR C-terminal-related transcriptional regulator [Nonomuraea sp. B12E4]|uniref:helix-turn-helix transcriptional regulator n=1 Tax=Nonomuraea sp. B12E4 TaxID=3153564 RepID=UPI00325C36C0